MALTATVFLASLAVFDVLAVPLAAESATDMSSALSSSVPSTYSDAGSSSSTLILGSAEAIATTTSSTVSSSGIDSQNSVPASSTDSQALSSASLSTTASPTDPLPTTITSTIFAIPPTVTVTGPAQTVTDTITIVPPPTPAPTVEQTAWSAPAQMTDLAAFNIRNFAFGQQNMRIIVNAPPPPPSANNGSADGTADAGADVSLESLTDAALAVASAVAAGLIPPPPAPLLADPAPTLPTDPGARSFLQLFYPANSINPAQEPQGGADFYAAPLDLRAARNVSLAYSVFFPADFDWVQAGKLPGVYGGHEGCSGGDDALECFSTRLMWRENGQGELYLYAPKDKQTTALCETPPLSVCDADYGLSIGRGAFVFTPGDWTHVRQTVALNTPGQQDGAFALDVNGVRVIERSDVYYRGAPAAPDSGDQDPSSDEDTDESAVPGAAPANPLVPREDAQKTYAKGPFGPKVDSVLALNQTHAAPVDAEEFTPEFAPYAQYPPPGSSQDSGTEDAFTPAFAPPSAFPPGTRPNAVKFADPAVSSSSEEGSSTATATCTTTVVPPPQTVTVYPTSTETAYTMAIESDDPSSLGAEAVASPTPIGFTGLFFSTFFGGHEAKYATPKDQFTWFKDFEMTINN
ncbi:polysaccharide lyase family 14 protein [Trametes coccinea BRFM310]|uniref:Polysaccharide lyase family 14 protein n=1 Tax=Trametes coccinea (strain BRFM310) TaxID=1353009 RepID=A0A1Y2IN50_TRAC3|nr:polysaccharide lyase family 14 protein [Trametes coccinea BRFM310]